MVLSDERQAVLSDLLIRVVNQMASRGVELDLGRSSWMSQLGER